MIAMIPYFQDETGLETFLKENAINNMIPRETRIKHIIDLRASSAPTEGPIEVKLFSVTSEPKALIIERCSCSFNARVFML